MFGKRKKAPSVRIPASVLRKEAQKAAKKMIKAENLKEKKKLLREKAKLKAGKNIQKQKDVSQEWEEFFHDELRRELWAGLWVGLSVILSAIFFSSADTSMQITHGFQFLFGLGMWLIPIFLLLTGGILFIRTKIFFPPKRIVAIIIFFLCILTLVNLFTPHAESLELSPKYGGVAGFTLGFFPREFLGTFVTSILFLIATWATAMMAFGIQFSKLFHKNGFKEVSEVFVNHKKEKVISIKDNLPPAPKKKEKARFENKLEIIDNTKTKETPKTDQELLDEAKNKDMSGRWEPPSLDLLKEGNDTIVVNDKLLREKAEIIREKLEQFGLLVEMKSVHVGPTVTQFTLQPSAGVKLTKITSLKNDLALALASSSVRIEAPIRGKSLVGIEIPNEKRAIVGMREILESDVWAESKSNLTLALGRDVSGKPIVSDLAKMPHLMIAGKTGSGKSVAMNAFLCSLLWQNSPENLRLILIDPKRVELKPYDKLPHLLTPVIVEPEKSVSALAWAVAEMNRRYKKLSEAGVRNIAEYNEKFKDEKEPYIVIVIDELADLMMVAGKDVEAAVCRIAQMARAVGMHLIIATQRPSVDVVTGLIKANLPARMAFKVSSSIDSRTIIDGGGAEDLLGFGDMLNLDGNSGSLTRIQGIYISNEEVIRITNHIKLQFPEMIANDEITNQSIEGMAKGGVLTAGVIHTQVSDDKLDAKFEEAVDLVIETGKASASFLQRRLEVGYARAARILDQMEGRGIIGPSRGAKAREVYGRKK